jgi:hypothetical protein
VVDYLTHDIICGFLFPSENQEAFLKIFRVLREINYPLKTIISDDIVDIIGYPMRFYFPKAKIQLCQKHFADRLKTILGYHTSDKHKKFVDKVIVFLRKRTFKKKKEFEKLFSKYGNNDIYRDSLLNLYSKRIFLFHYLSNKNIPRDNNLIELYNSHLEGRLKTIKGFGSFDSASSFLNAWMIRRRTKKFSSCSKKFSYLNGKYSLEFVLKDDISLKEIQENT